jgi:glycosyltransferase involved in cell wall biosynthesis
MQKISIITPCFNHGKYIPEMLDSVFKQTLQDFEVIIVNDGSTDDTAQILDTVQHEKVRIFHTKNHGPAHARNLAISKSNGEIILNLDADNKIAPDFIEKCAAIFDTQPNVGIVYCELEFFGAKTGHFILEDFRMESMLIANCIDGNACFRKSDWQITDGYSDAFIYGYEDFDFWLSILELKRDVYRIKEPLLFYRTFDVTEPSRSMRCIADPGKIMESIVLAFQRHEELYRRFPKAWDYCRNLESELFKDINKLMVTCKLLAPTVMKVPEFSIITPTKHRPELLRRAINSVLSQSFVNFEQIIIDDANDPDTERIVVGFKDERIKYVSHEKPSGAGAAYNTGMSYAKGRFINFLDDDDEYLPEILQKIHDSFENSSGNPGFIWTGITRVRDAENGEEHIITQVWPAEFSTKEDGLTISTAIGNGYGFSIKRECIDEIGEYDQTLTTGQDTDFLIRLSKIFEFRTIPEVMVKIHHHGKTQLTDLSRTELRWKCYGQIMERHFDFLARYFKVIHIHSLAYLMLCYQVNRKNAGRKFMWKIIKKYPFKKLLYQDFLSYEFYGTDYISSNVKGIGGFIKEIKFPGLQLHQKIDNLKTRMKQRKEKQEFKRAIKELDNFRKNYDKITFDQLVSKANVWLHQYPEQASYTLPLVQRWIENYVPKPRIILEIGGWRGDLADAILKDYDFIHRWDNYDVISDQSTQKCHHEYYQQIPLSNYIWNLKTDSKYNALIASHMIEHIKWRELVLLIHWIPENIKTILFEAPIAQSAENFDWTGHYSTHILEKGWEQVINEMRNHNFEVAYLEKDTVIFIRK